MIKDTVFLGIMVVLLVGILVYAISPGELQIVYAVARNRISAQATELLVATLHQKDKVIEQMRDAAASPRPARKITPDPFRPFAPRPVSVASRFWVWLKSQQASALWVLLAAVCLAAKFIRRKQFEFASQQRMALSLSRAVRQM